MTLQAPPTGVRVVHIASGREWRGGQRQVYYLAQALARRGARQLVVTGRDSRLARDLTGAGCPVADATWRAALDPRALVALLRAARPGSAGPPILHAHDPHALTLAAIAAARYRLPLVVTRRVDFPLRRPWLWRRANRVVAISQAIRRVLEAGGIPAERIAVVPSGIPLDAPPPVPIDLRARLGLAAGTPLAVSVGALVTHKDYPTLLRAAAALRRRCPTLHWVIAGEGPERVLLEAQRSALGLDGAVHLIGVVDDGRPVIAEGDLFVASSREEGLNTSVLDAMALGVPVVSTDAGGLPEAVGDAGLLCPRGNAEAIASGVGQLLEHPDRREHLRLAALERVRRFSSDRMAEGTLSVYHSVAPST